MITFPSCIMTSKKAHIWVGEECTPKNARPDSTRDTHSARLFLDPLPCFGKFLTLWALTLHYLSSLLLSKLQNLFWGLETGTLKTWCVLFCFDFLAWTNTLIINWGLPIWGWLFFLYFLFFFGVFVCVICFSLSFPCQGK